MINTDLILRLEKLARSKNIDLNTLIEDCLSRYEYNALLTDIVLDAVISANASYEITAFNHGAEKTFGYTKEEILGQQLERLIPSYYHEDYRQNIQEFSSSPETKRIINQDDTTLYWLHKDGFVFPAEATIFKSGIDENLQFHVVLQDVSDRVELNKQLKISEERLRMVMDNVTDLVCLHELDARYNFVSLSSAYLTGYKPEELLGQNPFDNVHPDDLKMMKKLHSMLITGEKVNSALYRFQHKEGYYIWCETKAHVVRDSDNKITHFITGTRNVTEQVRVHRELQHERNLLANIMNTSPSGICVIDKSGKVEFTNKRSEEILRANKTDQTGHTYDISEWKITELNGLPWSDEKRAFVRVMTSREPVYDVQYAMEAPDGQRILLSVNGAPIFDAEGEISKVVFSVEDITELKRAEQSLHESLIKEQEVNTLKSRFLSIVSHEFRTPLSVILSSVDIIEMRTKGKLTEKELNRIEQIRKQVRYLDIQLDEVSIINKSNQINPTLNLQQTYVVDILNQLIAEVKRHSPNCPPITVITPHTKMEYFLLDPQLIQHIITNLLSNAVKYSNGQGEITIIMTCTENNFYFSIKDQGIGIPQADYDNLFEFFFRSDNVGSIKGTGIGLPVVKQSVTAHHGEIDFISQEGIGSTFTVTIPIQNM